MPNIDVSDPAVAEAYSSVRNDKSGKNWALFGYDGNKIVVQGTGGGGFAELKGHFKDDEVQYAYVRVVTGDEESKRAKFVFVSWCGEKVKALKRAQQSVHKADVKTVVKEHAVEVHYTRTDELDEGKLVAQVVKAGGANYMGQTAAH